MAKQPFTFTILTKEGGKYFDLLESARRWGWKLHSFFESPFPGRYEESYHKFIAKKHQLIKSRLLKQSGSCDQFLFVDAWDSVFLGPPGELEIPKYTLNFSGSLDCYPEKCYSRFFSGTLPFLNSGVIWGEVATYLARCPEYEVNDQLAWTREMVQNPTGLFVDSEAKVALTTFGESDLSNFSRVSGRWRYNPTGSFPLVLHAGGKWPMSAAFLK